MKFTQNTPIIAPNNPGITTVQAVRNPMAYGGKDEGMTAYAGAMGQVMKLVQKEQDDKDAADTMEARNKIMGSLTESLYGEKGILTTGIGENAKGLQGRVRDTVQKTFDTISKGYNRRVQQALRGNLNENMGNYLRIAASQEGKEFRKQKDSQYGITINNGANMSMLNYQNADIVDSTINDLMNIVDYRAKDQGFSEIQRQQERRRVLTVIASGAMQAAIDDNDLDTASIYADRYGKYMEQGELMKYQKVLRQETRLKDEKNEIEELTKTILTASGEPDWNRIEQEIRNRAKQTKVVGGGGSGVYSGDAQTDELIQKYANKYNLPVDLFAALGSVESDFNQGAVSSVGAKGMYQLTTDTAASLGVDPDTLEGNIEGGAKYLRQMLDTFGGNEDLAIAAYNAGPGAVKDAGNQIPNYAETQNHVKKVKERRGKYKGGVSFEKLDDDIDASGVQIDGAQPQTIGMINRAKQIYKNLFGRDDFWVSSVTGGHNDGTPHALGYKADVGGSALKESYENRIKFQQALQAEGIGANNEYDQPSEGSTGPHFDLDSRGKNWQTGEEFGGFKGGGSGGRTVNAHDSGYEDRMIRRLEAARSDWMRRKKDEATNRLQGYQSQIQNAGSAANALSILERIKSSEQDPAVYSAAIQTARTYYPDAFKVSNNITGARRGGSSSSAKKYWDGKSGKRYTNAQKEEAEKMVDIYNNDPNALKYNTQEAYDRAARIMNDIWATNYNDNVLAVVQGVWSENKGDWYSTVSKLQEKYGMSANEAGDYVNYWLRLQNDSDE